MALKEGDMIVSPPTILLDKWAMQAKIHNGPHVSVSGYTILEKAQ